MKLGLLEDPLRFTVEHLFWLRKLPQSRDDELEQEESKLLSRVSKIIQKNCNIELFSSVVKMMQNFEYLQNGASLNAEDVNKLLDEMQMNDTISLFIRSQNAGIMLTKRKTGVLVGAFEVSCTQEPVTAPGNLHSEYPGPYTEISNARFNDSQFKLVFSRTLADLTNNVIQDAIAQVAKKDVSAYIFVLTFRRQLMNIVKL
jgi:hypothetical protein